MYKEFRKYLNDTSEFVSMFVVRNLAGERFKTDIEIELHVWNISLYME